MRKKIFVIGAVILGISLSSLTAYTSLNHTDKQSNKIVGSKLADNTFHFNREPIDSIDELLGYADLVVIGTVKTDAVTVVEKLPDNPNNTGLRELKVAYSEVEIEETLFGNSTSKTITFKELGEAGKNNEQTKVKKGDKVLLVLHKGEKENLYASVAFEDGVFNLKNEKQVFSLSDNPVLTKYDNKDINLLKDDFIKSKNKLIKNP